MLAHGFARVRCESCKAEFLVAFSCKGRGVCPSCNAKRAHVTAVHLVEQVLPHVPYRQWTLSFPHRVRWVLLKDVGLLSDVLTLFLRAAFALQRRRARRQGLRGGPVVAEWQDLQSTSSPHDTTVPVEAWYQGGGCTSTGSAQPALMMVLALGGLMMLRRRRAVGASPGPHESGDPLAAVAPRRRQPALFAAAGDWRTGDTVRYASGAVGAAEG